VTIGLIKEAPRTQYNTNHPTTQKRQEEKRNLIKAQRINGTIERKKTYSEIMKASKEDSKLF
jgi:hypothetical protein